MNGVGKITIQKSVFGMLRFLRGQIIYDGRRIDGILVHDLISFGICHVLEGCYVFLWMIVVENFDMGAFWFCIIDWVDLDWVLMLFLIFKECFK